MRIKSIKYRDTLEDFVYDLTVDKVHNYFAEDILVHNCHRIPDEVMRKKISPMFKSSKNPKLVKIGISLYNNHFRESFESPSWTKLIYPWNKCQWLYKGPIIKIDGEDYPKSVIDDMPLSYKKDRFPNSPEVHYPSVNNMLEEDFDTQYEMIWCDTINKFLRDEDQIKLIGAHAVQSAGNKSDTYFFGLDCAGGGQIEQSDRRDYTELVIVRRTATGVKEVVGVWEWQGDIADQISEVISLVHPTTGIFKCRYGAADYSTMGSAIVDFINKEGINVNGIKYKSTETATGKNYKNAIFDQFLFELRQDKFKYPAQEYIDRSKLLLKHIEQWEVLERRKTSGLNDAISAPTIGGYHDDACNAAALACWAAERSESTKTVKTKTYSIPIPIIGSHSSVNRTQGAMKSGRFL